MKRRHILSVFGTIATGATLASATGAFSSVQAQRDLSVHLAGDANAYLRIAPADGPNGAYATRAHSGTLELDFTDSNGNVPGEGINRDAITHFDEVFVIQNQGTNEVKLTLSPLSFIEIEPGIALLVLLVPLDSPAFGGEIAFGTESGTADITSGLTETPLDVGEMARFSVLAASFEIDGQASVKFTDKIDISAVNE